jgi:hypothetical protein
MSEPEKRKAKTDAERQAAYRERNRQKEGRSKRVKLSEEERKRRNVESVRKSRERAMALKSSAAEDESALQAAVEELSELALQLSRIEVEKISAKLRQIVSKRAAKDKPAPVIAVSPEESAQLDAELDRAETPSPIRSARSLAASRREVKRRTAKRAERELERKQREQRLKAKGLEALAAVKRLRERRTAQEETVEELLADLDLSDAPPGRTEQQ